MVPNPQNEPVRGYAPGAPERAELKAMLRTLSGERPEIPVVIGGVREKGESVFEIREPHRHATVLATAHAADGSQVARAIDSALNAKGDWSARPFEERAAIFLKAAELLATRHRARLNAATMLGQGKTVHQAEIDSACEAIDFLRFNVYFAEGILAQQPRSSEGVWNQTDYRPLDGFVMAIAPFNFTAIALNLCTAPALMGNVVLFKPSPTATLSAWHLMELLREAGLPDGVIQFLPGDGAAVSRVALESPELGGIHFTGSTATFRHLWRSVGERLDRYRQYPRLVGETGGKDFIVVHPSAVEDLDAVVTAIVRGGYEYQGQKCSAASRVYVPRSLWAPLAERLREEISALKMGDVRDFRNFMGAVIDQRSFAKARGYLQRTHDGGGAERIAGGGADGTEGWFIEPTLIRLDDLRHPLLTEEIFAPIVGMFVYPDAQFSEVLKSCDAASPYALTGSIFSRNRAAVAEASRVLRHAAGNFYINDKPTGAVVGQQPFGGSRASGTNDKAGSALNLLRWTSPRTIKETFGPPSQVAYPWMREE